MVSGKASAIIASAVAIAHQAKITPLHSYFPFFAFPQTDSGRQRHNGA
jgi:hypothetical protein